MAGIPGQIISEFGELGKKVGTETAKAPVDILGKTLESLGTSGGKKQGTNTFQTPQSGESAKQPGMWEKIDTEKDPQIKKAIARAALEELIRPRQRQKELSVWERIQQEEAQKKEAQAAQKAQAASSSLPAGTSKRPRGDLYGIKAKRAGSEIGKNVKHD